MNLKFYLIFFLTILNLCTVFARKIDVQKQISYCESQVLRTISNIGNNTLLPRSIEKNDTTWKMVSANDWTSGFWPGILWHVYENSQNEDIKNQAIRNTKLLESITLKKAMDHDLGFQIFCSYGNAYRLTGNEEFKKVILRTADTLSQLYNPKVGTMLSWPGRCESMGWPHNTIMDNMMNLEILLWAAKNGGSESLKDMAVSHANKTMKNQFRPDYSCYHVAVYDTITGNFIKGVNFQGYADRSSWARGQAWAIYGFVIMYRETKDKTYLRFVEKIADAYLMRLPKDFIPFWDFDSPNIPNEPKDAASAAIVASALIKLSQLEDKKSKAQHYQNSAISMLKTLSSCKYQSKKKNSSFLLHSVGNFSKSQEINASIIYADYYYLEAIKRLNDLY